MGRGVHYLLWTCSCSLWCSCCEMWVRPAMGALTHVPATVPPARTALAVCPPLRPSSPSAGRGQPAQRDPFPGSQPRTAPAAPSPAHPSPRRPPALPGARGRAGVSPARCWAAGRRRSGRGGFGNIWPGCPGWSGEAEKGKHHHVSPPLHWLRVLGSQWVADQPAVSSGVCSPKMCPW